MFDSRADTKATLTSLSFHPLCVCVCVCLRVVYIISSWSLVQEIVIILLTHYSKYMLQQNINYIHVYMLHFGKTKEMCFGKQSEQKEKVIEWL